MMNVCACFRIKKRWLKNGFKIFLPPCYINRTQPKTMPPESWLNIGRNPLKTESPAMPGSSYTYSHAICLVMNWHSTFHGTGIYIQQTTRLTWWRDLGIGWHGRIGGCTKIQQHFDDWNRRSEQSYHKTFLDKKASELNHSCDMVMWPATRTRDWKGCRAHRKQKNWTERGQKGGRKSTLRPTGAVPATTTSPTDGRLLVASTTGELRRAYLQTNISPTCSRPTEALLPLTTAPCGGTRRGPSAWLTLPLITGEDPLPPPSPPASGNPIQSPLLS